MAYANYRTVGNDPLDFGADLASPASKGGFSAAAFGEKLKRLDTSQASVTIISQYMIHQAASSGNALEVIKALVAEWVRAVSTGIPDMQLALIYLANDVLQSVKKQRGSIGTCSGDSCQTYER